jgi:class 3 adenylate cyclase
LEKKVEERTAEVVAQSKEIEGQKGRIEDLLLNILPKEISEELKDKGKATARRHDEVTVLFTDMKGFTQAAEKMTPEELVNELDECFIQFDEIVRTVWYREDQDHRRQLYVRGRRSHKRSPPCP